MNKILLKDFLVSFRNGRGLSQSDLVKEINQKTGLLLGQGTLSAWETGRQRPKKAAAAELRKYFRSVGIEAEMILQISFYYRGDNDFLIEAISKIKDVDTLIKVFSSLIKVNKIMFGTLYPGVVEEVERRVGECLELFRLIDLEVSEESKQACLNSLILSLNSPKKPPE